jgi:predicted regulator of Ras-like GTPase activity (Roadblock/LC7/MglB family)
MKTVLQELTILPGVVGSCVVMGDGRVLAFSLPVFFTEGMAVESGSKMRRMMQMAAVKGLSPQIMSIRYDKYTVLALPINDEAILLTLCGSGNDTSLIATTCVVLQPDLEKKLNAALEGKKQDQTGGAKPEAPAESNEEIEKALALIKKSLFETIGPVADMVYAECVQRWTENANADMGRMFELLACISQEIDSSELFTEFKGKIVSLL